MVYKHSSAFGFQIFGYLVSCISMVLFSLQCSCIARLLFLISFMSENVSVVILIFACLLILVKSEVTFL